MIKQADINLAYQQGVQAAMAKLAADATPEVGTNALIDFFTDTQQNIARNIGMLPYPEGSLSSTADGWGTPENLGRVGMLGGAITGTHLGGGGLGSLGGATVGALGGAQVGGNLGHGIVQALNQLRDEDVSAVNHRRAIAAAGALGGFLGGTSGGILAG